jgi:hypothetical protein
MITFEHVIYGLLVKKFGFEVYIFVVFIFSSNMVSRVTLVEYEYFTKFCLDTHMSYGSPFTWVRILSIICFFF